jgi:very-short-patch-repair endonuclease
VAIRKPAKHKRPAGSRSIRLSDIGPNARLDSLKRRPDTRPGATMTPTAPAKRQLTPAEREERKAQREQWERRLEGELQLYRPHMVPAWEREYHFHPTRRWRFDFAWPGVRLAVEIEGLSSGKSRHTTFAGYAEDTVKYNTAALMGWRVLRFTQSQIRSGEARDLIVHHFREERIADRSTTARLAAMERAIGALCTDAQRAALHLRADEELERGATP